MGSKNNGIPVESTGKSLKSRVGNSLQPSERAVVPVCSIEQGTPSSVKSKEMAVLLALLEGITANTYNGDVIQLSVFRAKDTCRNLGIDEDLAHDVITRYLRVAKNIRSKNVMAWD